MDVAAPASSAEERPIRERLGRDLRVLALALILLLVGWAAILRPDYLDPTQIGTDVDVYRGAGERLLSGGEANTLSPGDRPAPIWPPAWTGPLVSPPSWAVVWLLGALPPASVAIVAWWLGAFAITVGIVALIVLFGPLTAVVVAIPLSLAIAITSWTGNVNGYLLGLSAVTWALGLAPAWRRQALAGGLVAVAAAAKAGPILLLAWLIGQRRWAAVAGALAVGGVLLVLTFIIVGPTAFSDYLAVARQSSDNPQPGPAVSVLLRAIGMEPSLAALGPYAFGLACALVTIALAGRPAVAFAVAVIGSVFVLPVVRYESLAVLMGAFLPWTIGPAVASFHRYRGRWMVAGAAALVVVATVGAIGFATARTSGLVISNAGARPLIVRVYFNGIPESFGYRVPATSSLRAWGPLTGSVNGPLLVFDESCRELSRSTIPSTGGWLQIAADGTHEVTTAGAPEPGAFAPYDSACAERAP